MKSTKVISIETRWPAKIVGTNEIEITIPLGEGYPPLISEQAAENLKLSQVEYLAAEEAALRAILIVK